MAQQHGAGRGGPEDRRPAVGRLIRAASRRAGAALAFERVWPALLPPALVAALFLTVSWFGLWLAVGPVVRLGLVGAFALALCLSFWPLLGLRLPTPADARHRVETRSGLEHRPITALEDRLAVGARDAATERLWQAHRTRSAGGIDRLSAGLPEPRVADRDPYALRAAVLLLFVVGFAFAGTDWRGRVVAAFAPLASYEAEIARIDAWVSPPGYTGRPPILLTGEDAGAAERSVDVPQGSVLVIRAPREAPVAIATGRGEDTTPLAPANPDGAASTPAEYRLDLESESAVTIAVAERPVYDWRFGVIPDRPPSISLSRAPDVTVSNALRLSYTLADDYGVVAAEARFQPTDVAAEAADPLVPAPDFALTLPQVRARSGGAQTIRDLTAHPWAGAKARLRLVARDDAGQEGLSDPVEITLPQRQFQDPLARAVVEQRRSLATNRDARQRVSLALDALAQAPEQYIEDTRVYLALRSTYWRLRYARDDDGLRSVVDQLWELALQIEDGDLSLFAGDLRAAQERLMRALEDGASDEELRELMAELRQALSDFLREMARRGLDGDTARMPLDPNAQTLTPQDLDRMLDAIEEMARSGATDAARQMLSELQNLLENLQAGRMMQGDPQAGPMGEMMNELADMIRRQQELMDQTFEADRDRQDGGAEGGEGGELGELGEGQGALREALEALMERLRELGAEPGNELGQAGEAMGEAQGALGQGDTPEALGQQGRALDNLRRGSQAMAESMMQDGEGFAEGQPGPGRERTDPFGRPLRNEGPDFGHTVEVPDEIDVQRARQILEELRRRLSDPSRPRLERDYLERLLERF